MKIPTYAKDTNPLYAKRFNKGKREQTEADINRIGGWKDFDHVMIYHFADCSESYVGFPWHQSPPTRRNKYITINGYTRRLVWLAN